MNILITGGAGFLGDRLARTLLLQGTLRGQRIASLVQLPLHQGELRHQGL